jgi:hypothetical protein
MKLRPRRAENEVAKRLTAFFVSVNMDPVERLPVIGRTGPDITMNELGLAVDVKSRLEVPKAVFEVEPGSVMRMQGYYLMRLADLELLLEYNLPFQVSHKYSRMVGRWFTHMQSWRRVHQPNGFTALVLHRPRMKYDDAVLVVRRYKKIQVRLKRYDREKDIRAGQHDQ